MYYAIKLYSDLGKNIIIDHVIINQEDGKEQYYFKKAMELLEGYPLVFVKVNCSLDELLRREIERGDQKLEMQNGSLIAGYILKVDILAKLILVKIQ